MSIPRVMTDRQRIPTSFALFPKHNTMAGAEKQICSLSSGKTLFDAMCSYIVHPAQIRRNLSAKRRTASERCIYSLLYVCGTHVYNSAVRKDTFLPTNRPRWSSQFWIRTLSLQYASSNHYGFSRYQNQRFRPMSHVYRLLPVTI